MTCQWRFDVASDLFLWVNLCHNTLLATNVSLLGNGKDEGKSVSLLGLCFDIK